MNSEVISEYPTNSNTNSEVKTRTFANLLHDSNAQTYLPQLKPYINLSEISVLSPQPKKYARGYSLRSLSHVPNANKDFKNGDYIDIIKLRPLTSYEEIDLYVDKFPLLDFRKALMICKCGISEFCQLVIFHQWFEYFIIAVILANTVLLSLTDQSAGKQTVLDALDFTFLVIYTIEMGLKIGGLGLVFKNTSYFRDYWNVLDCIIVITGWVSNQGTASVNISSLRTLRILRPLRGITSISGLRVLFIALITSIKQLLASLFLLLIFLVIFAIAALQLWSGILKNHCVDIHSGIDTGIVCGDYSCPDQTFCAEVLDNPQYGVTNFDNLLSATLIVFQCVTLEGWTDVLFNVQKAFSRWAVIYFVLLTFTGAYLLVNLTLAVIKGAFTVAMDEVRAKKNQEKDQDAIVHTDELARQIREIRDHRTGIISQYDGSINSESDSENLNSYDDESPKRKSIMIRRNSLLFNNYVESSNTGVSRVTSNIGRTITKRSTMKYQRQITNGLELGDSNSLTPHLISMNSTIKVNKSLYKSLGSLSRAQIKVQLICESLYISDSAEDVIPKKKGYEALDTMSFQSRYYFRYRIGDEKLLGMDEIEDQIYNDVEEFVHKEKLPLQKLFQKEALKHTSKIAFIKVKVGVMQFIKCIKERDNITKNIIAIWTDVTESRGVKISLIQSLSNMNYRIWKSGFPGFFEKITTPIRALILSKYFTIFITLIVISNIITLSLNRFGMASAMETNLALMNTIFTIIFAIEMGFKILGLGIVQYSRDTMNYMDGIVTILSIIELIFISKAGSAISAFRGVRIFRLIRVVRIVRLFRYMQSMAHIFQVISKTLSKFIYLALFLLLLIIIYSLLGIKIFAGKLDVNITRSTFDTFHWAFVTIFQVLTLENWQNVLFSVMKSDVGPASALFLVSWIFLGNYVVLNLFLAILLDAFSETDEDGIDLVQEDSTDPKNVNRTRTSLYKNFNEKLNKKREDLKKKIEEFQEDDSEQDNEMLHLNSISRLEALYDGVDCVKSYKIFSKTNKARIFCMKMSGSSRFEGFIFFVIVVSSVKLVVDTYMKNTTNTSTYIDVAITFSFAGEFIIKSIAFGLVNDKGSYLRDWWNSTDFIIVVVSIVDFAFSSISIKYIKVFRLLRTLRPLRFISHNVSMKIVVKALLESIVAIINVVVVCMIVWLMFAILGVSLFGGKLYSCKNSLITTKDVCISQGYVWSSKYPNYDNIINAMITLFILSSLEGWPDIMYTAIDAVDIGIAPVYNYNPYVAYYFISFVFVGALFFLNLFIGVIFDKFNEAKTSETHLSALVLNKEQVMWVEMQRLIINSKLKLENNIQNHTGIRGLLFKVIKSDYFQYFILVCIVLNMVQMAIYYENSPHIYTSSLETVNLIFTIIFIIEALVKLVANGVIEYFKNNWNKFDFFVAITSALDLFMTYFLSNSISLLRLAPQLIRILKVLRVSRLVRLFKILKPLQNLLTIMTYSLPAIMNVLSLLLLIFFIYAVLGVYLFGDIEKSGSIDSYSNFTNFGMAMITLFRCSTGENWYIIMQDFYDSHGIILSCFYFMSFITISTFVMFNLFIMVILQNYDDYMSNPDSVIKNFYKDFKEVKLVWTNHCKDEIIHFKYLREIMYELGEELGVNYDVDYEKLSRILASLNLEVDSDGSVYFKDFLYALLRRKYAKKLKYNSNAKKVMVKEESSTKKKLKKMKNKVKVRSNIHVRTSRMFSSSVNTGNCFMEMMCAKSTFNAWRKYVERRKEKCLGPFESVSITPRDFEEDYPGITSFKSGDTNKSVLLENSNSLNNDKISI